MIGVQAVKKRADILAELTRMDREAELCSLHGNVIFDVRYEHGKPIIVTTTVVARAKL